MNESYEDLCVCGHSRDLHRGKWCFGKLVLLKKDCDCNGFQKKPVIKTQPTERTIQL